MHSDVLASPVGSGMRSGALLNLCTLMCHAAARFPAQHKRMGELGCACERACRLGAGAAGRPCAAQDPESGSCAPVSMLSSRRSSSACSWRAITASLASSVRARRLCRAGRLCAARVSSSACAGHPNMLETLTQHNAAGCAPRACPPPPAQETARSAPGAAHLLLLRHGCSWLHTYCLAGMGARGSSIVYIQ